MLFSDYIIYGGENLNQPPEKSLNFPDAALALFNQWHGKLGKDDAETENYLELPCDAEQRLFIRACYVERSGQRPICYFWGIVIPKKYYQEHGFGAVQKAVCSISLAQIQQAMKSQVPLEVSANCMNVIPGNKSFADLCSLKMYGDDFAENMQRMRQEISACPLDEWFGKLILAVNPHRLEQQYNVIVARKRPRPTMEKSRSIETNAPRRNTSWKEKVNDLFHKHKSYVAVVCLVGIVLGFLCDNINKQKKIDDQEKQIKSLNEKIMELKKKCEAKSQELKLIKKNKPESPES